jgi:hypothetical protein
LVGTIDEKWVSLGKADVIVLSVEGGECKTLFGVLASAVWETVDLYLSFESSSALPTPHVE